jgi:hypothetical protein
MAGTIDIETTRHAIQLAGYYREHALIAFGLMGQLPEQRRALTILGWLHERSDAELETLTVRDIHRARTKGTTVTQVRGALRLLEGHGYLRVERQQASAEGGRPSERVHVHPSIKDRHDPPDETDKTPNAGGFVGSVGRDTADPSFGDEMYPILLAEAVKDGHITESEAEQAYAVHRLVLRALETAA